MLSQVSYTVYFRPEEAIDYYYELEFVTERERFFVPIHGLGPRPQLQLPDIVDFGDAPACFTSERTFLVRNVGNKAARVYLSTESPFQCIPYTTNLEPQEAVQVQVSFSPTDLGEHDGELLVECDGADPQVVQLVGDFDHVRHAGQSTPAATPHTDCLKCVCLLQLFLVLRSKTKN